MIEEWYSNLLDIAAKLIFICAFVALQRIIFYHSKQLRNKHTRQKTKTRLCFVLRFAPNQFFFEKKKRYLPFFFAAVQLIGLKTFLQVLWSNLGVPFFPTLKNIVPIKFGSLDKIRIIQRITRFFAVPSVFCFSWAIESMRFKEKQKAHPNFYRKKF